MTAAAAALDGAERTSASGREHSIANSVAQKGKWMTHLAGGERAKRMTYHSEQISNCDSIPTYTVHIVHASLARVLREVNEASAV